MLKVKCKGDIKHFLSELNINLSTLIVCSTPGQVFMLGQFLRRLGYYNVSQDYKNFMVTYEAKETRYEDHANKQQVSGRIGEAINEIRRAKEGRGYKTASRKRGNYQEDYGYSYC